MDKAYPDLNGLFQAEKRNRDKMGDAGSPSRMHNLHHVVSESPWAWEPVRDQIGRDLDRVFRACPERTGRGMDALGWKKAGTPSVGVARPYLGRLGKGAQGPGAGWASLGPGDKVGIRQTRRYLPECWTSDRQRGARAGIPEAPRVFRPKPE